MTEREERLSTRDVDEVLNLLSRSGTLDVLDYRRDPLARRILGRLEATGCADGAAYRRLIEGNSEERERLAAALLVHATGFFRDAAAFQALESAVVPALLVGSRGMRAWAIGVASGEEAWTLAAVLERACQSRGATWSVLATDRDPRSLATAARGVYAAPDLAPELRERILVPGENARPVRTELRERVNFAHHDIMGLRLAPADAVLLPVDLVLCRNVLIYLDDRYQAAAFERLAAIVRPGGAVMLGTTEAVPADDHRYEPFPGVPLAHRIYRRRGS